MARQIQLIKKELESLQKIVSNTAVELSELYKKYFLLLGELAGKELMLCSYKICTQVYPEAFLEMSYSQRHKLQQQLASISKTLVPELAKLLDTPQLPAVSSSNNSSETPKTLSTPQFLLELVENIEKNLEHLLANTSLEANKQLQICSIVPNQVPPKLLEMAIGAEKTGSSTVNSSHLMNILVEKDQDQSQPGKITKLVIINLRLSELEFSNLDLGTARNQLRKLITKIEEIELQYRQKNHELAVAEAEAAWRASWFEE